MAFQSSEGESNFGNALDKNPSTRWTNSTLIRKGHWIAFDFGYPKKIGEIDFNLGTSQSDFPDSFKVLAGPTAASAREVECIVSKKKGILKIGFEKPISAQVVKLLATADKSSNWWSIHEVEFKDKYVQDDNSKDPAFAFNGIIIDFNSALDGSEGSRWSSNKNIEKGAWLGIDFKSPKKISKLLFNLGYSQSDFPSAFKVFAGKSMNSLSEVPFKSSKNGSVLEVSFEPPVNARVFKIVSGVNSDKWWSVHEFEFKE